MGGGGAAAGGPRASDDGRAAVTLGDDRHHDQQFDEREPRFSPSHRAPLSRPAAYWAAVATPVFAELQSGCHSHRSLPVQRVTAHTRSFRCRPPPRNLSTLTEIVSL